MQLPDVNVLVYAHRADSSQHERCQGWLENLVNGGAPYAMSDIVLSGFLRIVTHPRIFRDPSPLEAALAFTRELRSHPHCVCVTPGERHWEIFVDLCGKTQSRGNLVPDAYLAALAIESRAEWVSTDRDYARFPGLRWTHP